MASAGDDPPSRKRTAGEDIEQKTVKKISKVVPEERDFSAPVENLTDVVLNVGGEKFHVSRQVLANYCDFFNTLFYKDHKGEPEVTLADIDPVYFQSFLELVYGELAIKAYNVEGLIVIADKLKSEKALVLCGLFLVYIEPKSLERMFELAVQYKMDVLAEFVTMNIDNMVQFEALVGDRLGTMDPSLARIFNKRARDLNKAEKEN